MEEVVEALRLRANVNCADELRWSPLHHAVAKGNLEICALLCDAKANVNAVTDSAATPLYIASGTLFRAHRDKTLFCSYLVQGHVPDGKPWW